MKKNQLLEKLTLLASFFLVSSFCFGQVVQEWVKRYDVTALVARDEARSIALDPSGNVLVTGQSIGVGTGNDFATVKYSNTGAVLWVARYNGPANLEDKAKKIAVDLSGNVYVTGSSEGLGTGIDYVTVKYSPSGTQLWAARYNGPGSGTDMAYSISVDASGNCYVTGESLGATATGVDYATIKYNSSGIQQWVARYNGPANDEDRASTVFVNASGNVYVTGASEGIGGTSFDYATIKYSAAGVVQWVSRYHGTAAYGIDYGTGIAVDLSGNVYVTGSSNGVGSNMDYATVKYNNLGTQLWVARYNGPGNGRDWANALVIDGSGNVYITGESILTGVNYDYATVKYSTAGIQQWAARYNGPNNTGDAALSLAVDAAGSVYVTGWSHGGVTEVDYATLKYNSVGDQKWIIRYTGFGGDAYDQGSSLVIDGAGNVYVTGFSLKSEANYDYATIKYSQPTGKKPAPLPVVVTKALTETFQVSNYPNPVSVTTRIQYEIPFNGRVAIKLYDELGREVSTLVDEQKQAGYHFTQYNASALQKGIYYYKVVLAGKEKTEIRSGEMVVVK